MTNSRREFIAQATTAVAGTVFGARTISSATTSTYADDATSIPIIDTHQHLWDLDRFTLPWIDLNSEAQEPIRHTFLIPEYRQHTTGLNIAKTIYMEVNIHPDQQQEEADWAIGLCESDDNNMAGAIIGGFPHDDGFASYVTPLARNDSVKGVRTILHDPDRPKGLCLQPRFVDNIRRLGDLTVNFDLCMRPAEISDGAKLAKQCPETRFVVDHCGNLSIRNMDNALQKKWQDGIRAAADQENVFIKISGIVASAKKGEWSPDDLAPTINYCLDTFGEDRCVFGGDWPVCLLGASYREWVTALKEIVSDRSIDFQRKLFYDNAVHIYRLT